MTNGPSKQALALTAAMTAGDHSKVAVAEYMGVTPGLVSQWATGRRPIPAERAARLAEFLGIEPKALSAKYAAISSQVANSGGTTIHEFPQASVRPDLTIARLENDIDSLRLALGALVTVMTVHRPAEGEAVAKALRRNVPAKFVKQGYIAELLHVLERGAKG